MKQIILINESHNSFGDQIFDVVYSDGTKDREVFQEGDWHTADDVIRVLTGVRKCE